MSQAIKYETTKIDPTKSAQEIMDLVQKYGGSRFEMRWDNFGRLTGIRFAILAEGIGEVPVRLDAQAETVCEIFRERKPYSRRMRRTRSEWERETEQQAHRIAWRQLRDFVEQALLAVETGLFPIAAAFMAHVEVWDEEAGETVTMGQLVGRRARLGPGQQGLLIGPGNSP